MTPEDQAIEAHIRRMLHDELIRQRCQGLARKIDSGFDQNPRTIAAINVIRTILDLAGQTPGT
jgi:hypothetical protein